MNFQHLAQTYFENDHFVINHSNECPLPGYFIVAIKDNITSLTDLSMPLYNEFMLLVKNTYTIVEKIIKPAKIYTCMFGELQPKLHVHVFPRTQHLTEQYVAAHDLAETTPIDAAKLFQWAKLNYQNELTTEQQSALHKKFIVAFKQLIMLKPKTTNTDNNDSWYKQLINMKDKLIPLKTAVVHPVDMLSLQGAIEAAEEQLIIPILVGPAEKIHNAAKDAHLDISGYELIPTKHSHEAAEMAVKMVRAGKAEAIMKGKIHTDELMLPIINKEKGLRTGRRMSHIFSMETPNYFKPLFITDAAINIQPDLKTKKDIVQNAIDLFCRLGMGKPKVAILSATESVNEKIPSTLDATALCKMAERGQITGGLVDGPLAFDNAISFASAHEKGIYSQVAGQADILIVPDLESGNMLYKQMTFLAGVEAAGIVLGACVPIILTSRSSDIESRKASCAMALLYVRNQVASNE